MEASIGFGFDTPAHTTLLEARNAVIASYSQYYDEVTTSLESRYDQLLAADQVWERQWNNMVTSLVKSSKEIS